MPRTMQSVFLIFLLTATAASTRPVQAQALRVIVYDETNTRPLPPRAEAWVRCNGSWWLKRMMGREIMGAETLRICQIGALDSLYIYADARNGKEIVVPFRVTTSMCRDGCARDAIYLEISDDSVKVFGPPVAEATYRRR